MDGEVAWFQMENGGELKGLLDTDGVFRCGFSLSAVKSPALR